MERARYLVDAVVIGGQSPNQLARSLGISRSWLFERLARFRKGGYPAIEPRSRRPHVYAQQVGPEVQAAVLALRQELTNAGDDAGPQSIAHRLAGRPRPKTRPPPVSHTAAPPRGRSRPGPRRSIVHLHLVAAAQQPLSDGDAHPAESDDADFHVPPTPLIAPGAGPRARTELRARARRRSAGARWTGSKRQPPRGGRDCARTCRSASG